MDSRRSLCLCALLLFLTAACVTTSPEQTVRTAASARIDALLAPRIRTREANGTVLIFQNGVEVLRRNIGMADFEHAVPVDSRTVFSLASISKTFTAGAAMMLRAEQRLRFPAPVADYLPGFPRSGEIRVFHLLAHSSGLGDVPERADGPPYQSVSEVVEAFASAPLAFDPGSRSRYSNAGYVLAARLIEVASGQSYDHFLQSRIFAPLGITSAGNYRNDQVVPGRALAYYPGPSPHGVLNAEAIDTASSVGAGSLMMTADDLMRWLEATRTRRLFDIWAAEYPFGWGRRTYFELPAIEQTGRNAGFGSSALIVPDRQLSVLCLFNTQSGFALRCASEVAAALLDLPPPAASIRLDLPVVALSPSAARAMQGIYTAGNGWRLEFAHFNGALHYRFSSRWLPVTPSTENRFLLLPDSALVTAEFDEQGGVARLGYNDGGQQVVLSRAQAP